MAEKVLLGRKKAIQSSFIRRGTRPEFYQPERRMFSPGAKATIIEINNCELCGMHIERAFLLVHKDNDADRFLVGGDCIMNFVETYMPDMATALRQQMKLAIEAAEEEFIKNRFNLNYPNFKVDRKKLFDDIRAIIAKHNLQNRPFTYRGTKLLTCLEHVFEVGKSFDRAGYVSKPKTEELYRIKGYVDSGKFEEEIVVLAEYIRENRTIEDDIRLDPKSKEFYDSYLQLSQYIGWNRATPLVSSPALSPIERERFNLQLDIYKRLRKKIKKKIVENKDKLYAELELLPELFKILPFEHDKSAENDPLSKYNYQVKISSFYYGGLPVRRIIEDLGMVELNEFVRNLSSRQLAETFVEFDVLPSGNGDLLFLNEELAQQAQKKFTTMIDDQIDKIQAFLESDDLYTTGVH